MSVQSNAPPPLLVLVGLAFLLGRPVVQSVTVAFQVGSLLFELLSRRRFDPFLQLFQLGYDFATGIGLKLI